jgi:hypothetical protein
MSSALPFARSTDLGVLLGLNGRGMLLLYGLFGATYLGLSFSAGHLRQNWVEACVLVLMMTCGALVSAAGPYPLPLGRVAVILVLTAAGVAAADSQLPPFHQGTFADWHFGASNFILFALALRGRIGAAWLGMAIICLITAGWSILATGDALLGISLEYGQAAALLAGTFFAVLLRRTATRIREFQMVEVQRIAQEHLLSEGAQERAKQLSEVRAVAAVPLSVIARGAARKEDRLGFLLLEAELRDRIRGRRLCQEPLTAIVREARSRGREVVLLDDLPAGSDEQLDPAAIDWAATLIASEVGANITVRLGTDDGGALLTYVAEGSMPQILRFNAA